jgi:hypothetical protein
MTTQYNCELCGEPMPVGEEVFKFHGYSGPCPKPPLPPSMKIHRWDSGGRDVTDLPGLWSADDIEVCQTNFAHPSITFGQHTNGPAMIWTRRDGGDWVETGDTHLHKVRARWTEGKSGAH